MVSAQLALVNRLHHSGGERLTCSCRLHTNKTGIRNPLQLQASWVLRTEIQGIKQSTVWSVAEFVQLRHSVMRPNLSSRSDSADWLSCLLTPSHWKTVTANKRCSHPRSGLHSHTSMTLQNCAGNSVHLWQTPALVHKPRRVWLR